MLTESEHFSESSSLVRRPTRVEDGREWQVEAADVTLLMRLWLKSVLHIRKQTVRGAVDLTTG